jgi:hypothetical protein
MKTLIASLLFCGLSWSAFGQGEVFFDNYLPGEVDAPVSRPDGTGAGAGITGQLMLVSPTGALVPIGPPTTFRTSPAAAEYYVNPETVTIPGDVPGTVVVLRMVAYNGSDFADSTLKGESSPVTVTLGGGIAVPPNLDGLQGFTLTSDQAPPTISASPQDETVAAGVPVTFTVTATGSAPLSYQWQFNNKNITGANSSSLNLGPTTVTETGSYQALVMNGAGSATSQVARLTVEMPPHITSPLHNLALSLGGTAAFTVQASGSSLKYRWQHNGKDVSGATSPTLKVSNVQNIDTGTYNVIVSNDVGQESSSGSLTINGASSFVQRQLPGGYAPGSKLTVSLNATPNAGTQLYLVEDTFPTGWTVGTISDNGVYDALNQKVKFGPVFDTSPHTFTYELTPPAQATGEVQFTGDAVADGQSSSITGDRTLSPLSAHPADNNPTDFRITAVELTAYGAAWKQGGSWPIGPNPIPASYVSRAGTLWRGGEYYKVDTSVASGPPQWWVNTGIKPHTLADGSARQTGLDSVGGAQGGFVAEVPSQYVPGLPLAVKTEVAPPPGTLSYVVEETVPAGWTVSNINENGAFDQISQKVKWGLFFDGQPRSLTFDLLAPAESTSPINISGVASFDGNDVPLGGQTQSVASSQLGAPGRNDHGGIDLTLTGGAGQNFAIEVSTDLVNWTQLKTFNNLRGLLHFEQSNTQQLRQQFFRAVVLP